MYTLRQLSVFLENKPGRLCAALDALAKESVNISALTLADTANYGILRLIVDDPDRAGEILSASGVVVRISHVLAVSMSDEAGSASNILHLLSGAGLNIEYMYVCVGRVSGKPIMILRTDDYEKGAVLLEKAGYVGVDSAELSCE